MTIVVETGAGLANSNSYVTEAELTAFATDRGITIADADREKNLFKAMDYIETLNFVGNKKTSTQALQWPRENVYIDGFEFADDAIPNELKQAQMHLALAINAGTDPLAIAERATRKEKVDVLEVEYIESSSSRAIVTSFNTVISKLLKNSIGGGGFQVVRV